jgi:Uma2 family endonuclease
MRGLLYGVAWNDYVALLDALGDHPLRHTYDRGTLEMMAPRKDHDWPKRFIGRIIEAVALRFDIDIQCIGSTTLTGSEVERGFQPDEAYYVANESRVRGRPEYDAELDPPPDLIVEVDVTSSSVKRMPGFASLGIPEVWRHDGKRVGFCVLDDSGEYREATRSAAFPFLSPDDVSGCLDKLSAESENAVLKAFIHDVARREGMLPPGHAMEGNAEP